MSAQSSPAHGGDQFDLVTGFDYLAMGDHGAVDPGQPVLTRADAEKSGNVGNRGPFGSFKLGAPSRREPAEITMESDGDPQPESSFPSVRVVGISEIQSIVYQARTRRFGPEWELDPRPRKELAASVGLDNRRSHSLRRGE
jgi:hypothetical protein